MKKNRIKVYWLLLLVLLYTAGAVLSVGEAQAKYVSTATWNTVMQQEEYSVTSDCLEAVSEPDAFHVLLGTLTKQQYEIPFTLTSTEEVSGNLTWTVNNAQYVSVNMQINDVIITPETTVKIAAGETVTVVMFLSLPETVFTEVRDALTVSVAVSWDETLHGTFLAQLPAVEEEEPTEETEPPTDETEPSEPVESQPTEPTEPQPTEPQPTEPQPTDPTEPQPTDPTEPDSTDPTESQPTDPTQPQPTDPTESGAEVTGLRIQRLFQQLFEKSEIPMIPNTEISEDETIPEEETTQPPAETEPVTTDDPEGQSEEGEGSSEPENPGEGTGDSEDSSDTSEEPTEEPTEPVQEETPAMTIDLTVDSPVNAAEALPIQITAPENGGSIRLGIATVIEPADPEGESQTVLENFPRYTRFSLTDGDSCFMLYHADTIALSLESGETISLLLDLSHVDLEQIRIVLGATPLGENTSISTCPTTVIPESTQYTSVSSRILSTGTPLEITVSEYWKDYQLEYTVEMLTTIRSEDGETETVDYLPVQLPEDCLLAEFTSDESGTKLIFSIGETLPPAGTYRVSLNWTFEEVCYAETQEIFFINYSIHTEYEKTGGAEQ